MTSERENSEAYLAPGCALFPGPAERQARARCGKPSRVLPVTSDSTSTARPQETAAIAAEVDLAVYRHTRRDIFGSRRSIQRFVERYCDELLNAGALISADGRLTVRPPLFDEVVEAVGRHPSSARRLRDARTGMQ